MRLVKAGAVAAVGLSLVLGLGLVLGGCGGIQNLDPLGSSLGGATDNAIFNFENGIQGWACQSSIATGCVTVSQDVGQSFAGKASLQVLISIGGANATTAAVGYAYAANGPNLTGLTVSAWVYAPASINYSTSDPSYTQIYMKDSNGNYANGAGVNMNGGNWVHVTFAPVASPSGSATGASEYYAAGFNPLSVAQIGLKFGSSGSAPSTFSYYGNVLIDSVNW
jgi:hypothetical protein